MVNLGRRYEKLEKEILDKKRGREKLEDEMSSEGEFR